MTAEQQQELGNAIAGGSGVEWGSMTPTQGRRHLRHLIEDQLDKEFLQQLTANLTDYPPEGTPEDIAANVLRRLTRRLLRLDGVIARHLEKTGAETAVVTLAAQVGWLTPADLVAVVTRSLIEVVTAPPAEAEAETPASIVPPSRDSETEEEDEDPQDIESADADADGTEEDAETEEDSDADEETETEEGSDG